MSIFEYDEEKEWRLYREAEREVGIEQTLSKQIRKKIAKNISLEQVAKELEMDFEEIIDIEKGLVPMEEIPNMPAKTYAPKLEKGNE